MNIVWIGFHEEGLPAFKAFLHNGKHIAGFITLDDQAFEKRSAGSREYVELCHAHHIPVYPVSTIKGEEAFRILSSLKPDLVVVLGWSEILPERLLEIPSIGTVGTHAALLPHNRGSAPVNWALIHGETVTGNTLMWLSKEVDAGSIIDQASFPITPYDTCGTLYQKVAETNASMLLHLISELEQGHRPVMDISPVSDEPLLPRRRPKDGLLSFRQSAQRAYDFIRALTDPYPGAFAYINGKKWMIWKAAILPISSSSLHLQPGEISTERILGFGPFTALMVGTQTDVLLLFEIENEQGQRFSGQTLGELDLEGRFFE